MAKVRTSAIGGGTSGTTDRTVAITAAVGDLIVVFGAVSGVAAAATCSDTGTGGTYTSVNQKLFNTSADSVQVFVRNALVTAAGSITITYATGTNVSAELCAVAISGMSKAGAAAIFQNNGQANQSASSTPAPVLTNATKTYNLVLTAVGSDNTVAGPTKPATFTLLQSAGQVSNNIWLAVASQNSGFTSGTVTWASTCATVYGSLAIELDASPFSPIQGAAVSGTGVATVNVVLGAAPTLGNVVVSGIALGGNVTGVTCKDSNNNSYVVKGPSTNGASIQCYGAYLLSAPANATATITWAWTTNSNVAGFADEFNPCGNTIGFDNTQNGTGASGTTINTPSITPANATSLLWAVAGSGGTISAPTNTTKLGSWWGSGGAITNGDMAEYALGLTGANAVNFTQSTAAWACIAMSFVAQSNVTVTPTGSVFTASLGTPVIAGGAVITPTGSALAVSTGTPSITGSAVVTPTGLPLAMTIGTPAIAGSASVAPTGNQFAFAVGTATASGIVIVTPTGLQFVLSIGTPAVTGGAVVTPTGNQFVTSIGTPVIHGSAVVNPTGSALAASLGTPTIAGSAVVSPTGSSLALSTGTPTPHGSAVVSPTGSAIAASIGTPTIAGSAVVSPSGNALAASIGSPTIHGSAVVAPTGNALATSTGTPTVAGSALVSPTGSALAVSTGTPSITGSAVVSPSGSQVQFSIGSVSIFASAIVTPTGLSMSTALGTPTVTTNTGGSVTVFPVGLSISVLLGSPNISGSARVTPAGSVISASEGNVSVFTTAQVVPQGSSMSAAVGDADVIPLTPPTPNSIDIGVMFGSSFGVSKENPATIQARANSLQLFHSTGLYVTPSTTTADGYANLGQKMLPGRLLVLSQTGRIQGRQFYIVAAGSYLAPLGATNSTFQIILYQNYFAYTAEGSVYKTSFPVAASGPISIAESSVGEWTLTSQLNCNNKNRTLLTKYTLVVGSNTINNSGSCFYKDYTDPVIQLSIGVLFAGDNPTSLYQSTLTQFQFQQRGF